MILKSIFRIAMVVLGASFAAFAQDADPDFKCLAFEKNTTEYKNRLYLVISGDSIGGNQSLEYDDGAEPGAVEQLMKLGKGEIAITEGELEEHGPNQKTLKDPKNVPFTKIFQTGATQPARAGIQRGCRRTQACPCPGGKAHGLQMRSLRRSAPRGGGRCPFPRLRQGASG